MKHIEPFLDDIHLYRIVYFRNYIFNTFSIFKNLFAFAARETQGNVFLVNYLYFIRLYQ